jgi:hypothetical protein
MSAIETAIRVIVDLLTRGQFDAVERITRGRRLSAERLAAAITSYGRTLVSPGESWWASVEVTPIDAGDRASFHIAAPLWTTEEGLSDLTVELRLVESAPQVYETEVLDIHVL